MKVIPYGKKRKKPKNKRCSGMPKHMKEWRKKQRRKHFNMMAKTNSLESYFYMIKMFKGDESFIKIGISVDIENRYKSCPYDYKILIKESMMLDKAWDFESFCFDKLYKLNLNYTPKIKITGSTECFKTAAIIALQDNFTKKCFVRVD